MCSALLRIGCLISQPSGEPPSCSPCPVTGSVSTHVLNAVSARPQGEGLLGTAPVLERMRQELRSPCWEAFRTSPAPDTPASPALCLCALPALRYRSRGPGPGGCSGGRNHSPPFIHLCPFPAGGEGWEGVCGFLSGLHGRLLGAQSHCRPVPLS